MKYEIKLDVHTHTVMSGHAYSTLQEMVAAAQQKKLDILGITEHAPGIPASSTCASPASTCSAGKAAPSRRTLPA